MSTTPTRSNTLGALSAAETQNEIRQKNTEVIKEIVTGDFEDGGLLNRQQFANFYQRVQNETTALDQVRTVSLNGPQAQIDKIGVGERQLRAVGEAERADLRGIDTSKIDIDVAKTSLPYELSREVVEDTIEYENTSEIILNHFTQQYSVDTEDLAFNGDEDDADEFLGINDGWLKIAEDRGAEEIDHGDETVDTDLFYRLAQRVPDRYHRTGNHVFYISRNQGLEYKRELAERQTDLGDQNVTDGTFMTPVGYPVVMSPVMPHETIMFADPMNLIHAVHRDMRVGVTMDSERVVMNDLWAQYNLTSRFDFQIEEVNGLSLATNVDSPWVNDDGNGDGNGDGTDEVEEEV